jgi:hypothetical protein
VLATAIAHRLYYQDHGPATWLLILMGLITAASLVIDYIAGVYGAKKLGATWRGMAGAVVGAIAGLFFSLPGIIIGPFLGATLFELIGGYEFRKALKAGVGATLGLAAGAVGKLLACGFMMLLFTINVLVRSID